MADEAIMGPGVQVSLWPKDIWEWTQRPDVKKRLKSEIVSIAESGLTGYEICVSVESNLVTLYVYDGDKRVYNEAVVSTGDCQRTAQKLFDKYLPKEDDDDEDMDRLDKEAEIEDREDYLHYAFIDFLSAVCDCDMSSAYDAGYSSDLDDVFEEILLKLATEHDIPVYRPMFIVEEETGNEVYTEYPYEDYDLSGGPAQAGT